MGLLYPFPVSEDELDHVRISEGNNVLTLKTYGLPYIFWGYLAASYIVLFAMYLGVKNPLLKLMENTGDLNWYLGFVASVTFFSCVIGPLFFFFYEKRIVLKKEEQRIEMIHSLFHIPVKKENISPCKNDPLLVVHYLVC